MKDPKPTHTTQASGGRQASTPASPGGRGWRRFLFGSRSAAAFPDAESILHTLEQRREQRTPTRLRASTATVDPVRDRRTGEIHYESNEDQLILNLSRRGIGLRCERPPTVGSRLLLEIHVGDEFGSVELIGRTCWTRVELLRGERGRRTAATAVGIELLGGSRTSLERYDRALARLRASANPLLATRETLR